MDEAPFCVRVLSWHEARGRDRARVDHRVRAAVGTALDAGKRVERMPRRIYTQTLARARRADQIADEREHEGFGDAHDGELDAPHPRPK